MDWNDGDSDGDSHLTMEHNKQPPLQDQCSSFDDIFNKSSALLTARSSSARAAGGMNRGKFEAPPTDNHLRPRPRPRPRPLSITKSIPSSKKWSHARGGSTEARPSRALGQTFNPVPLSSVPAHSGRFSSKDRTHVVSQRGSCPAS
jgi:hypothetical protein